MAITQKRKKKNKLIPLIIMLVLLGVLTVAYLAVDSANKRKAAEDMARYELENRDILIADFDYTTCEKPSFTKKGNDTLSFTLKNDVWIYDDDAMFPLDQYKILRIISAVSKIKTVAEVTDGTASDYGLEEPDYVIGVSYTGYGDYEYKIGAYNSFNKAYYFETNGSIYMIPSGLTEFFNESLTTLAVLDAIPSGDWADIAYVNNIEIKNGGISLTVSDAEEKEAIVNLLSSINLREYYDYHADESELNEYGLDGSRKITVNYKKEKITKSDDGSQTTAYLDTTWSMILGNENDDGTLLMIPEDSAIVYKLASTTANALLGIQ